MKASKAIEMLKGYALDEDIYILWWDSEIAEMFSDEPLTKSEWAGVVDSLDYGDNGSEEISDCVVDLVKQTINDREGVKA
tara:strand:- start:585 stop:824 length:240 start_codon:yes stop_codon:yes gene_type:complete